MNMLPIKKHQKCPKCERDTMETVMLDRMVGRTGFLADACHECGYLRTWQSTLLRPAWHWALLGLCFLAAVASVTLLVVT